MRLERGMYWTGGTVLYICSDDLSLFSGKGREARFRRVQAGSQLPSRVAADAEES